MKPLRKSLLCALLALCLLSLPTLAAKTPRLKLVGSEGYPALDDAHRSLKAVPFEKDAQAVILLEQWQARWESRADDVRFLRLDYYLRIKILDDAVARDYTTRPVIVKRPWFIKNVQARTLLPDGSEREASIEIDDEIAPDGLTPVGEEGRADIRFAEVGKGSILDLHVEQRMWGMQPFIARIQHDIPSLGAHVALIPPGDVHVEIASLAIPRKNLKKKTLKSSYGTGLSYSFAEIPSLPDESNRPHDREVAQQVLVMLPERLETNEFVRGLGAAGQIATTQLAGLRDVLDAGVIYEYLSEWKDWNESAYDRWETWRRSTNTQVEKLAEEIAGANPDTRARVQAVADTVKERLEIVRNSPTPLLPFPDAALTIGRGSNADAAGLAYTLLRAMDIDAHVVALRTRGSGRIPPGFPVPILLNAVYVEVQLSDAKIYVVPGSPLGVESLPREYRGVATIRIDGETDAVRATPDFSADENRSERTLEMKLAGDGTLTGNATILAYGVAGEELRAQLRGLDTQALASYFAPRFEGLLDDVKIEGVSLHAMDVPTRPLTVRLRFEGELPALGEEGALAYRPHSLNPVSAEAWPDTERELDLDFGEPVQIMDTLVLELPPGTGTGPAPENKSLDAPPVGRYGVGYRIEPTRITSQRLYRLNSYLFPADAYEGLSRWFRDMAETDDATIEIELPK